MNRPGFLGCLAEGSSSAIVILLLVSVTACSGLQRRSDDGGLVVRDSGDVEVDPFYQVPDSESSGIRFGDRPVVSDTSASRNKTVLALLNQAKQQERSGHPEQAASVLERALRIDPRNAQLWHRLALLRLQQGQYTLAANLAAKSNALARDDHALKEKNQALIQQTRRMRGQ